jgi:hypothetical protein
MTYEIILQELEEVNLKEKFTSEFESFVTESLLLKFKESDRIHSTGSLLRLLLKKWENDSEQWLYWQQVLLYFMRPKFARNQNQLP